MTKVAIVILNWNGSKMLQEFLPTVVRHSRGEGVKIYVADNASTDDSPAIVRTHFPQIEVIALDRNYGFAEGYNRALKQIESDYYVLLNSDVEVTPGWLEPLVDFMDSHADVAACQPKIRSWRNKEYFEYAGASGGFIDRYGYPFCRGRVMDTIEKDEQQYNNILPVFWVSGAAFFVRSSAYWQAGGLDGRFFAHMEEIDLCWRLQNNDYRLVCIPQSTVYHVGAATLKKENPQKTFLNFRNNLIMLYKNLSEEELTAVMRARKVLDYIAALVFLLKGQSANMKAVLQARKAFGSMKPELKQERSDGKQRKASAALTGFISISILTAYYLKRRKHFTQLSSL